MNDIFRRQYEHVYKGLQIVIALNMKPKPYRAETSTDQKGDASSGKYHSDTSGMDTIRWKYAPKLSIRESMRDQLNLGFDQGSIKKPVAPSRYTQKACEVRSLKNDKPINAVTKGARRNGNRKGHSELNGESKPVAGGFFLTLASRVRDAALKAKSHFPITFTRRNSHLRLSSETDLLDQIIVVRKDEPIPAQIYETRRDHPIPKDAKLILEYTNKASVLSKNELCSFPEGECISKKRPKTTPLELRKTLNENVAKGDKSTRSILRSEGIGYDFHDTSEGNRNCTAGKHPLQLPLSSADYKNRAENTETAESENSRNSSVQSKQHEDHFAEVRSKPRRCSHDVKSLDSKCSRTPLQVRGQSVELTSISPRSRRQSRDDDSMGSLRSSRSRPAPRQQDRDTRSVQSKASLASKRSLTPRKVRNEDDDPAIDHSRKSCTGTYVNSVKSCRSGTARAVPKQLDDDPRSMQSIYRHSSADEKSAASARSQTSQSVNTNGDDAASVHSINQRQSQEDDKSVVSRSSTISRSSVRSKNRRKSRGHALSRSHQHKNSTDMSRLEKRPSSGGDCKKPEKSRKENRPDPPSKIVTTDACSSLRAMQDQSSPAEHVSNCRGKKSRGAKDPPGVKKGYDSDQESSEHYDNFPLLSLSSSILMKSNDVRSNPLTTTKRFCDAVIATNSPWQPYT